MTRASGSLQMQGVNSPSDLGAFDLNQTVYSVMSYNDGWQTSPNGTPGTFDYGYSMSFGAIDIAALQNMYGANSTHAAGNTVYELATTNGQGVGYQTIWDTGGTDAIRFSGGADAVIDLREATLQYEDGGGGFMSYVDGVNGGFTIAKNAVIENATGGAGDDDLTGNAADNVLEGGAGLDRLTGGGGNDRLDVGSGSGTQYASGGEGDDTYVYSRNAGTLVIDALAESLASGDADLFLFEDLDFADLTVTETGADLTISWTDAGASGAVEIADFEEIEAFEFADGTVLTADELLA